MMLFKKILPPNHWVVPVVIVVGFIIGTGLYVAIISHATAYLSDDPKACINCHVMNTEYATWRVSSHRGHATCNDCHVPHENVVKKYFFKARDGMYHAYMFTLDLQPQAIKMHEAGQKVVMQNCLRCHENLLLGKKNNGRQQVKNLALHRSSRYCWECHREVPHGRTKSQSSINILIKNTPEKRHIPDWMSKE